jgi:metallo-beta-lactamase family protein
MQLTFLGGAETVTGSKTHVQSAKTSLLVDCGLFQGVKRLREKNWQRLDLDTAHLDGVVLTHAHLDHTGALPLLWRAGYRKPIYASEATLALTRILLADAARLEEERASFANEKKFSKHAPALPLYTAQDAEAVCKLFTPLSIDALHSVGDIDITLRLAGHILGATSVTCSTTEEVVVFSGDVGRQHDILTPPPHPPVAADVLVLESTYGGRHHTSANVGKMLEDVVNRTLQRGGILMVPAFAVGRAQALLYLLGEARAAGRIPKDTPIFLNSPMAAVVGTIALEHQELLRLDADACARLGRVATIVRSADESRALNADGAPKIVIAGSGMATGGRIVHHIEAWGGDARNTILLVGYQAAGTRGAALLGGASSLRMHGRDVPIRAEVACVDAMSAHADEDELVDYVRSAARPPGRILLNHGEPAASAALAARLRRDLSATVDVVTEGMRA